MRICIVSFEFHAYGIYGGHGNLARSLCAGLKARGMETFVIVRRTTAEAIAHQPDVELIEGTTVVATPKGYIGRFRRSDLYALPQADLYVSIEPRFDSWLAMRANPEKKHAVLFGNPHTFEEYWEAHRLQTDENTPFHRLIVQAQFESLGVIRRRVVHKADALYAHGQTIAQRAMEIYHLDHPPVFLPNPIRIPPGPIEKSPHPTVLFLGRWDIEKRPQVFFELARHFPEVLFVAAGSATDPALDEKLRKQYGNISNLDMPGRITGEEKDRWLRESHILVNTSTREGMPVSFLEALSYECALLASVNADSLPSLYGIRVENDDFVSGLAHLLENDRWRELGRQGREYVARVHEHDAALDMYYEAFTRLVQEESSVS